MAPERRRYLRAHSRLTATITHVDTGKTRRALTRNVSEQGFCLITEGLLPSGTRLEVRLTFPDRDQPLVMQAEVVWSQPVGPPGKSYETPTAENGLRIVQIDPKDRVLLAQYAALYAPPE